MSSTPRVRLPRSARPGEAIEVRVLLDHPMVSAVSGPRPRDMLARFEARMNGQLVFGYDFGNGTAANPILSFFVRAAAPGDFAFVWTHEDGRQFTAEHSVRVG